ncbi:uncharacterized protein LOC131207478 [Anopheles bellator]|uniref:uncharacterized protein LOC131207478 n=1 Tax=Anopheles bellator TaxID=139047 RepID=UPI002648EDCA|nr:uncharacterized protein LOC131207478 [Anopheles bellator]
MGCQLWITGLNPFDLESTSLLKEIDLCKVLKLDETSSPIIQFGPTSAYVANGNTLTTTCAITEQQRKIEFPSLISSLAANSRYCLVLLDTGQLLKYDPAEDRTIPLDFLGCEGQHENSRGERITHVACGECGSVAVTSTNAIYNIPNRTATLPKHERVRKIVAGFEHTLLLTSNGDVYSWGGGLRGQLGNGEIAPSEVAPKLVEALAGVKMVDIAAGGWHSAAVSSFGDLYTWGWNNQGQLGLTDSRYHDRVVSQPQLVPFSDGDENVTVTQAHCGIGHTVAEVTVAGNDNSRRILIAGWDLQRRFQYDRATLPPVFEGFRKLAPPAVIGVGHGPFELGVGPNQCYFLASGKGCAVE